MGLVKDRMKDMETVAEGKKPKKVKGYKHGGEVKAMGKGKRRANRSC